MVSKIENDNGFERGFSWRKSESGDLHVALEESGAAVEAASDGESTGGAEVPDAFGAIAFDESSGGDGGVDFAHACLEDVGKF